MEFEDILVEVGDFGPFQRSMVLLFLVPVAASLPFFCMNNLFLVSTPNHWCHVPELFNLTFQQRQLFIPKVMAGGQQVTSKCTMFDVNYTEALLMLPVLENEHQAGRNVVSTIWPTKSCTHGWDYDNTWYDETVSTKWNLVCSHNDLPNLVLTLHMIGGVLGTPCYGYLSDRIGRKSTFFVCVAALMISGLASTLIPNFIAFTAFRILNGTVLPAIFQVPCVIVLEIVQPHKRALMNASSAWSWTAGMCLLALVAYLTRHWFVLSMISSCLCFPFIIYWWWLPESPRWLLSQKRYKEAAAVLTRIAVRNGNPVPVDLERKLELLGAAVSKASEIKPSIKNFITVPQLRKKFICLTLLWSACHLSYYGLQLNTLNLSGNEFVNFFLLSLVEVPSFGAAWFAIDFIGRRWSSVAFATLCFLSCLVPVIAPTDLAYADVIASVVGKFGSSAAFLVVYQQASELYPTPLRTTGMGLDSTISTALSTAMPYVIYLSVYNRGIPFAIIALVCLIGGSAASFLPETIDENLPQTIEDAAYFGTDQKFFSWIRRGKKKKVEQLTIILDNPAKN